jgi:hypothetical protein
MAVRGCLLVGLSVAVRDAPPQQGEQAGEQQRGDDEFRLGPPARISARVLGQRVVPGDVRPAGDRIGHRSSLGAAGPGGRSPKEARISSLFRRCLARQPLVAGSPAQPSPAPARPRISVATRSQTPSGISCPTSGRKTRREPGIRAAIAFAAPGLISGSSRPCRISAGRVMALIGGPCHGAPI